MKEILIIIGIVLFLVGLVVLLTISIKKQADKDWDTLDYLKKKANEVSTKEEIEEFHKEFLEKASKIHNQFITLKLTAIDGYLRGLYKQYTK